MMIELEQSFQNRTGRRNDKSAVEDMKQPIILKSQKFLTIHTLVSNKQQRTQFSCRTDKQASQPVSELEKKGVTTGTANVSL